MDWLRWWRRRSWKRYGSFGSFSNASLQRISWHGSTRRRWWRIRRRSQRFRSIRINIKEAREKSVGRESRRGRQEKWLIYSFRYKIYISLEIIQIIGNNRELFSFPLNSPSLELGRIECNFVSGFNPRPLLQPDFHIYSNSLGPKK